MLAGREGVEVQKTRRSCRSLWLILSTTAQNHVLNRPNTSSPLPARERGESSLRGRTTNSVVKHNLYKVVVHKMILYLYNYLTTTRVIVNWNRMFGSLDKWRNY